MTLESEQGLTPQLKNKDAFIERLGFLDYETCEMTIAAYDLAEVAHAGQFRSDGEPYFTHPLATANILIDECCVRDADIIRGALLHDTVEDTQIFGDLRKLGNEKWLEVANLRLGNYYNPRVAEIVIALTKPKIDNRTVFNKKDQRRLAIEKLMAASPEALLVKMADRLHNLRTLNAFADEKAIRIIAETQNVLYPIFLTALDTYPREGGILLSEMGEAIAFYERSQNANIPHLRNVNVR